MAVNKKRQLFSLIALKWRIILATSLTLATGLVSLSIFHQLKINSHTQSFAITTVSKSKGYNHRTKLLIYLLLILSMVLESKNC
jgi:hypothetical protein